MPKKVAVGVVTSDRMTKTRVVEIPRLIKHPKYGKFLRSKTKCYVHDEDEQASVGDTVEIIESRPQSKTKRWKLVKVVEKSRAVDLAALKSGPQTSQAVEG
jgi:small subunit ribosomal protein S17